MKKTLRVASTACCLCRRGASSCSVPNLKQIALFVQTLLGGQNVETGSCDPGYAHLGGRFVVPSQGGSVIYVCTKFEADSCFSSKVIRRSQNFEIRSRDPGHAHLAVVLYSIRRRVPSSISVPNLKRIADFVHKLLMGPEIKKLGSRDPGHVHLGVVLWSLRREATSSMTVPNLKRIALFVQKLLGGPKFRPAADPFPGARDCQNLISWRCSGVARWQWGQLQLPPPPAENPELHCILLLHNFTVRNGTFELCVVVASLRAIHRPPHTNSMI